jgi:hypothetical protein
MRVFFILSQRNSRLKCVPFPEGEKRTGEKGHVLIFNLTWNDSKRSFSGVSKVLDSFLCFTTAKLFLYYKNVIECLLFNILKKLKVIKNIAWHVMLNKLKYEKSTYN